MSVMMKEIVKNNATLAMKLWMLQKEIGVVAVGFALERSVG